MAYASTATLASFALPQNRALRLATQGALVLLGTVVLTIAAKTKVPLGLVDMNLGTLAIMAMGVAFGWRMAVATLLLYLAQGAAGLPVFQGTPERGIGIAYMLGSTGGFLAGYVVLAAIAGWAADRGWDRSFFKLFGALLVADAILMLMGFAWLSGLISPEKAWAFGVQPFILVDLVKVAIVAAAGPAVWAAIDTFRKA